MSVITILPSGQNISVTPITSSGVVTLTESSPDISTVTINQGQQGPAGVSITISNYGDNRVLTSDGTLGGAYGESNLTFDGSILRVTGVPVSLSGHTHLLSDISGISGAISSGINSYLSTLSTIGNHCDIEYIIVQDSGNSTKLVDINNLSEAIRSIDGGGVLYSGC